MRLTPLEWGPRAPITPRLGEELWRYRALAKWSQTKNNKPAQNTKFQILPFIFLWFRV